MPVAHLTDIVVQRLSKPGTYYDETTPAFGIRIGKNRKTWIVMRGADRIRTRIGRYPATSLAEARKQAKKLLTEPVQRRGTITFGTAYEAFKSDHCAKKKARTRECYQRVLDKYFLPKLKGTRLAQVTDQTIADITDKPADTPSEQAHCLAVLRTFLKWCVRPPRRYIPHSPLDGLQVVMGKSRERVLKDTELVTVWKAAEKQGYPHGTIVQLLILTGQRRGEIANLRRQWIDPKAKTITLPGWVTKNGIEHTLPYERLVADVLETIPRLNSTDLLFPSRVSDERPISGWSKFRKELEDGVENWVLHDLRRTFATMHAAIGTPVHVTEKLLNHISGTQAGIVGIYQRHTYMPEMRSAMENYERHVVALITDRAKIAA